MNEHFHSSGQVRQRSASRLSLCVKLAGENGAETPQGERSCCCCYLSYQRGKLQSMVVVAALIMSPVVSLFLSYFPFLSIFFSHCCHDSHVSAIRTSCTSVIDIAKCKLASNESAFQVRQSVIGLFTFISNVCQSQWSIVNCKRVQTACGHQRAVAAMQLWQLLRSCNALLGTFLKINLLF